MTPAAATPLPQTLSGRRPRRRDVERLTTRAEELEAAGLDGICTIPEAMRLARVSRRTIYHWITRGWVEVRHTPSGHLRVVITSLLQDTASG